MLFSASMAISSVFLDHQYFFINSDFLQRLFILFFGIGEILLLLFGTFLSLKYRIIIVKKEKVNP